MKKITMVETQSRLKSRKLERERGAESPGNLRMRLAPIATCPEIMLKPEVSDSQSEGQPILSCNRGHPIRVSDFGHFDLPTGRPLTGT